MEQVAHLVEEFCYHRHKEGAEKYGPLTFLDNDVFMMALEEMADLRNYLKYQMIKIVLMGQLIAEEVAQHYPEPEIGGRSFINPHKLRDET